MLDCIRLAVTSSGLFTDLCTKKHDNNISDDVLRIYASTGKRDAADDAVQGAEVEFVGEVQTPASTSRKQGTCSRSRSSNQGQ